MELHNTEEVKNKFIKRTKEHIALVNKYAEKVGYSFPDHDSEKLDKLLNCYCYFVIPAEERNAAENAILDSATLLHIIYNKHHPEYWTSTSLIGFTRVNYTPNGPVDATQMPEEAIIEMVADWCASSAQIGTNTPMEWFDRVNGARWIFSDEQQELIKDLINKMW